MAIDQLQAYTCISVSNSIPGFRGLEERIANGETVLCAEGYLLAISRRGYITHGLWVPEFILDEPEVLRGVHEEFVHAGTDVVEAFQVRSIYILFNIIVSIYAGLELSSVQS